MIQVLWTICLVSSLGSQPAWRTGSSHASSEFEWFFTAFPIVCLALSVVLFFAVTGAHARTEQDLRQKLADSAATNVALRQKNDELTLAVEQLQQETARLS